MPVPLNQHLFNRFWSVAGAVSLRIKLMGIVLALVLLLGLGITVQVRVTLTRTLNASLEERGVSIARDLAARSTDLILINDLYSLHLVLNETRDNHADVRYAFLVDDQGQVLAHTFGEGFPAGLISSNTALSDQHHVGSWLDSDEGLIWDVAVPVLEGRAGTARVGLSQASTRQTIDVVTGQILLSTTLVSAVGIAAATFLTWIVTRPILSIGEAAKQVAHGDLSPRLERWAADEIGDLATAFNQMTESLARAAEERQEREHLRGMYVSGVIAAQEEERKRIARELHDGTSQSLTSLLIGLRSLDEICDSPQIHQQLGELRGIVSQTLDELHTLAIQLRPNVLDDLGLSAALDRHISDYNRRSVVPVDLAMRGLNAGERLPAPVETAVYRIVQEALTNIARHAGAKTASVLIERRDDRLRAVIEDDGCGFDPTEAGRNQRQLGLYGMRERAELLGGTLEIETAPGGGTSLFIHIPLADAGLPVKSIEALP